MKTTSIWQLFLTSTTLAATTFSCAAPDTPPVPPPPVKVPPYLVGQPSTPLEPTAFPASMGKDAKADPLLNPWRTAKISVVSSITDRHVIHSYFNTCPESPDGKYVLYYTSGTPSGELGDIRIQERATGKITILAENITTEDAHRVACQQWANNGKTVVYHDVVDKHWRVMAVDVPAGKPRVLAADRQVGYCSPTGKQIPIYGPHWNPGPYKDLELVDCVTGQIRTALKIADAANEYKDWVTKTFGTTDISVFFPVMSPDEKKIFFKPNRPTYRDDSRGMDSSFREGKIIYDLEKKRFIRQVNLWGHPAWTPDSTGIFEKGNFVLDVETGKTKRFCPSSISDHVNVAPGGKLFCTDADVTKRPWGKSGYFAVAVGSASVDDWVVLTMFDNTKGARTWRKNHPHPTFSADGKRLYFNANDGQWTKLMVAEIP
jgi:hypothetical protein